MVYHGPMSNETCSVDGCEKTVHSKGLCQPHYRKARRNGSPTAAPAGKAGRPKGSTWSPEERAVRAAAKAAREAGTEAPRVPVNTPTHCANGHEFTEATRYVTTKGHTLCRVCRNLHRVKATYGLTEEQMQAMSAQQEDACAICHRPFAEHAPVVDHDHATGEVRSLLCSNCNTGLGHFRDDPELLKAAVRYLRPSPRIPVPGSALEAKMLELGLGGPDSVVS